VQFPRPAHSRRSDQICCCDPIQAPGGAYLTCHLWKPIQRAWRWRLVTAAAHLAQQAAAGCTMHRWLSGLRRAQQHISHSMQQQAARPKSDPQNPFACTKRMLFMQSKFALSTAYCTQQSLREVERQGNEQQTAGAHRRRGCAQHKAARHESVLATSGQLEAKSRPRADRGGAHQASRQPRFCFCGTCWGCWTYTGCCARAHGWTLSPGQRLLPRPTGRREGSAAKGQSHVQRHRWHLGRRAAVALRRASIPLLRVLLLGVACAAQAIG